MKSLALSSLSILALILAASGGAGSRKSAIPHYVLSTIAAPENEKDFPLNVRSVDIDGSVYFYNGYAKKNVMWQGGALHDVDVSDSPMGKGEIIRVRNGIIALTTQDNAIRHARSYIKIADTWNELPYKDIEHPGAPRDNVFVYDINKKGEAIYRCGTYVGLPSKYYKWDPATHKATNTGLIAGQSINDNSVVTGAWTRRPNESSSERAAVFTKDSPKVLQNKTDDVTRAIMTSKSGATLALSIISQKAYLHQGNAIKDIPNVIDAPGWLTHSDFFLDAKGTVIGNRAGKDGPSKSKFRPEIYWNNAWSSLLPEDTPYGSVRIEYVSPEGVMVCMAHLKSDPSKVQYVTLTPQ